MTDRVTGHGPTITWGQLLVMLVVVGLVLAAVLPAIESQRADARQTACLNNLRQLGVALAAYHTANGSFPYGGLQDWPTNVRLGVEPTSVAWHDNAFALLLAHLESDTAAVWQIDRPWHAQRPETLGAPISALVCPANAHRQNPVRDAYLDRLAHPPPPLPPLNLRSGLAVTDYVFCKGVTDAWCARPRPIDPEEQTSADSIGRSISRRERGMFDLTLPPHLKIPGGEFVCREQDVGDGLDHTFAIGEGAGGPSWKLCTAGSGERGKCAALCIRADGTVTDCGTSDDEQPLRVYQFWALPPALSDATVAGIYLGSIFGCTLEPLNNRPVTHSVIATGHWPFDCRASIDWDGDGPIPGSGPHRTGNFRSPHENGANFLMASGAVRFVEENVDMALYRALSTIAGEDDTSAVDGR